MTYQTPARIQYSRYPWSSGSSVSITLPQAPGNHRLLVLGIDAFQNENPVLSITQTGVTWEKAIRSWWGYGYNAEIWFAKPANVQGAGTSITINFTTTPDTYACAHFAEYSGIDDDPLDTTWFSQAGNGSQQTYGPGPTTNQTDELIIGEVASGCNYFSGDDIDSFTNLDPNGGPYYPYGPSPGFVERIVNATLAPTFGYWSTNVGRSLAVCATFKAALVYPYKTISLVQNKRGTTAGSSISITLDNPPTDGNCLLIEASIYSNAHGYHIDHITQTGASWQKIKDSDLNSSYRAELWAAYNVKGAGASVVITLTGTAEPVAIADVNEWAGLDQTNPLDQSGAMSDNTPDHNFKIPALGLTVVPNELRIGVCCSHSGGYNPSWEYSYIELDGTTELTWYANLAPYLIVTSIGSPPEAHDWSGYNTDHIAVQVTFKAAIDLTVGSQGMGADTALSKKNQTAAHGQDSALRLRSTAAYGIDADIEHWTLPVVTTDPATDLGPEP